MFKEFKKFILRGNAVELAVGIVIGAAFTAVINSIVSGFITPLISVIYSQRDFSDSYFMINDSKFLYGDIINSLLTFLIVAIVVFFFVVQPINKLSELALKSKTTDEPAMRKCPYCLSKIPKAATKCMNCTSKMPKESS